MASATGGRVIDKCKGIADSSVMGGGLPTKDRKWRARIAALLVALFALQTVVRLIVMSPPFQRSSYQTPAVHALNMIAVCGVVIFLLHIAQKRKILQLLLALVLGSVGMILLAFDISSLVAIWFHQRVLPLATVPVFYCNAPTISSCIRPFPGIALTIAGIWLSWSMLVYFASDALAALNTKLLKPFALSGRIALLPFGLIAVFLAIWVGTWLAIPRELSAREPLLRFLLKNPVGAQPRALIEIARPNYQVKPSATTKPRLLVLISVDSLRADAVETTPGRQSGMPFLQSLSVSGKLHDFGPAVAICPSSYCGITGLLSSSDWALLQKGPPLTIADVLAANGYSSHYLLGGPHIRVLNLAKLYGPNVATMLDDSSPDSSGRIDDREQVRRLKQLKLRDPDRSFIFIHLMSAHAAGLRFDRNIRDSRSTRKARYAGNTRPFMIAALHRPIRFCGSFSTRSTHGVCSTMP